ncbi:Cation efflux system protein CusB precursor [Rubripirellula lacrimiformis]|uniref:Cation efflux system protein CusB n=1 Tax=Rubripirellula lacrimiformis TaxID=1930273 RepID=A0A517N6J7_9BACT|nr:efflux RND transporter periplasmic adaptor subunit [Rubripirellula lacrimiformis]QDT02766.1 Cation efflux system protein CusB precursor [Rubripirellula lacrimiformis]
MPADSHHRHLPATALLIVWVAGQTLGAAQASAQGGPANVVVAPVIRRDVASSQSFVANIRPRRQAIIGSAVDGRVEAFMVDAGQAVKAKQPLAQLLTNTINIELAGAEAELDLRRAELLELKNGSRPEEIALAEATMRASEAGSQYTQAKLARAQQLFSNSAGLSQDEFEAARAESLTAAARLSEAASSLDLVRKGPRQEKIDQAAARVAMQEQVVAGLKDRIKKYTIRSPFDGYVTSELTEAGAWARQGDPVAEVVEIDPIEVEVFVPESSIQFIRRGADCEVVVDAFPDESFPGTIDQIIPLADNRSRTFPVRVLVKNPPNDTGHRLLPGMLARVTMPTGKSESRMLVAKDALRLDGDKAAVFKVVGSTPTLVPVRTGPSIGSWISIQPIAPGSLAVDDLVVTRGNERLRPGQSVVISETQSAP